MSDTVSFAEIDGQHVELLAARTVLSMFSVHDTGGGPAPEQAARVLLSFVGLANSSPGPDGSSDGADKH